MNLLNKLTIKNLKLNKKRTVMTVIGIILSVALLTAVANMFFSAKASMIINTQTKTYNVVGIMERFPYRLESYEAPGYTFITYLEEQESVTNADVYVRYTKEALKEQHRVTADILDVDADAFEAIHGGSAWSLDAEEFEVLQAKISNPKFNSICNDYLNGLETGVFANSTLNALIFHM